MKEITISRPLQIVLVLGLLGAIGSFTAAQLPELQRYLRVRSM